MMRTKSPRHMRVIYLPINIHTQVAGVSLLSSFLLTSQPAQAKIGSSFEENIAYVLLAKKVLTPVRKYVRHEWTKMITHFFVRNTHPFSSDLRVFFVPHWFFMYRYIKIGQYDVARSNIKYVTNQFRIKKVSHHPVQSKGSIMGLVLYPTTGLICFPSFFFCLFRIWRRQSLKLWGGM